MKQKTAGRSARVSLQIEAQAKDTGSAIAVCHYNFWKGVGFCR